MMLCKHAQTYFVSPQGNDTNEGTNIERPLKTIAAARDRIREAIADGMHSDIVVYLRGGEYYLDEPVTFDERDSGRNGYRIVYRNYDREVPVINGGRAITGWKPYKDGIYCVQVEKGRVFHTLYENGRACTKARYPKQGYNTAAGMVAEAPKASFHFREEDIPRIQRTEDLQAFIWSGGPEGEWNWFANVIHVQSVDFENRKITLDTAAAYEIGAGSRYYIKGALELLSGPGEFYLDEQDGILYYQPWNTDIEEANIVAPRLERVVQFTGSSGDACVSGIVLDGLTLRNTDTVNEIIEVTSEDGAVQNGTVYLENACSIEIRRCIIHNTGMHGIYLNGAAAHNVITDNLIYDVGHTGVQIQGYCFSRQDVSHHNVIHNNHIHDCGRLVGHGAGIQLVQSSSNTVAHNRIHHTPRYSISLKLWPAGALAGKTINGVKVTRENAIEYSHTRNNIIEFNDVSHANMDSQDTGPIESWGAGPGNIIRNNRLHDSEIHFSFGVGLYLDDASNYFSVYNNIIHGLQKHGKGKLSHAIYSKGIGNHFYNNIVADNQVHHTAFGTYEMFGEPNRDLVLERNIFYNSGHAYHFENWSDRRFRRCDQNLYFNAGQEMKVCKKQEPADPAEWLSLEQWKQLLGGRFDGGTVTENPLFMAPERGDYRLRHDSPAYVLGFQDIDLQGIGLEADYPYADRTEPLDRLFVRRVNDRVNSSCIRMLPGEQVNLEVTARTLTGFVADLSKAAVVFECKDSKVATVDSRGVVRASGEGMARILVTATWQGQSITTEIDVLVE